MLSLVRRKVERPESKESGNCPNVKNCRSLVYLPTPFFTQTRPKWPKAMSYFRPKWIKNVPFWVAHMYIAHIREPIAHIRF